MNQQQRRGWDPAALDRGSEVSGSGKEATGWLQKGKKTTAAAAAALARAEGPGRAAACGRLPSSSSQHTQTGRCWCRSPAGAAALTQLGHKPNPRGSARPARGTEHTAGYRGHEQSSDGEDTSRATLRTVRQLLCPGGVRAAPWSAPQQDRGGLVPGLWSAPPAPGPAAPPARLAQPRPCWPQQARGTPGNVEPGAEPCRGEAEAPSPPGAAVPGQPQVCRAAAGKEPSSEAIRCEEKPISCCKGCFAQRFAKCADATALRRWDINTSPVDVDSCPTATQTLLAMFSLEGKRNTRGTALTTKSQPVEAGRLGLQEAGKALPWAQRSAEAASILGH